tara:strand:+ start:28630 stop:29766 length:1137 start_codon:yes stop_codon:yes gene_type:complete
MNSLKVLTILGTRPEIIKLSRVISEMDKCFDHKIIHTGQNYDYELNEIMFSQLDLRKPDIFLNSAGDSSAETIGNVIIKTDQMLIKEKPDAILILGDTNSCMSSIAAKRRKVPIFHMEAGNRCFDQRVPEEVLRKIIDHTADINLPYSEIAKNYLINEGLQPDRIIKTGSPMKEVLDFYKNKINSSTILERIGLESYKYFVVSVHREENVDSEEKLIKIVDIIRLISNIYKLPIIVSTHPRTRKNLEKINIDLTSNRLISFMKPFGFLDYVKLQINSFCVISDSGTISEESSILNFPALNLREAHERPEASEETSLIMVGLNKDKLLGYLEILKDQKRGEYRDFNLVSDYDVNNVSKKIVRIIASYTDYIRRVVWKEF